MLELDENNLASLNIGLCLKLCACLAPMDVGCKPVQDMCVGLAGTSLCAGLSSAGVDLPWPSLHGGFLAVISSSPSLMRACKGGMLPAPGVRRLGAKRMIHVQHRHHSKREHIACTPCWTSRPVEGDLASRDHSSDTDDCNISDSVKALGKIVPFSSSRSPANIEAVWDEMDWHCQSSSEEEWATRPSPWLLTSSCGLLSKAKKAQRMQS